MSAKTDFESFKSEYSQRKLKPFDVGISREFVYECLTEGIYNTELVLCRKGVKPVSRFIVEKESHGGYLQDWAKKHSLEFAMRPLSPNEEKANLNPRIRYVGYFSATPGLVAEAMEIDARAGSDFEYRIGELLGYPDCCNHAWSRAGRIPKEADRVSFFFDEYLKDARPENNPFFNFTQRSLSFFYPCLLSCAEAERVHLLQAEAIKEDAPEFYAEIVRLRSMPVLLVGPKRFSTLSLNLHFDEIFRVHFVGRRLSPDTVAYADFFLTSLSFLDQSNEPEYADSCVALLRALLDGDNFVADSNGTIVVRKGKAVLAEFRDDFSRSAIMN